MREQRNDAEVALVTGANKGIGREIARRLAAAGLTVCLGARNAERGRAAERELAGTGDVHFVQLDVTDSVQVDSVARDIGQRWGRLDALVNCAGIAGVKGIPVGDVTADHMRAVYEVNVFGVVSMMRACLPLLRCSPGGRVVNVSSMLGSLGLLTNTDSPMSKGRMLAYISSKTALNAVTVVYANALRAYGIRVNAVNPGLVGTDLNGLSADRDGVRSVEQGADLAVRVALGECGAATGRFFGDDSYAVDGAVPW